MDRYSLYAIKYGATVIPGTTEQDLDSGTEVGGEITSGMVFPQIRSINAQNPKATFTTLAVSSALSAFATVGLGVFGAPIEAGTPLDLYLEKHTEGGGRATGSVHRKLQAVRGMICPTRLTCEHQRDASISFDATIGHDGSANPPVIRTPNVSLPAMSVDSERFTLDDTFKLGNITFQGHISLSIDFGCRVLQEGAGSSIWPTHVSLGEADPRITISGVDPTWFAESGAVALTGLLATQANSKFYLRRRAVGGTYVADGTAQHMSFTLAGLVYPEKPMEVRRGPGGVTIGIPLYHDGTNLPLVVGVDEAIT